MESLVQRLVHNPHDQDAIHQAHYAGQSDPRSYAMLLEKVGTATADPAFASHWLTEAANVWSLSLGDAHRAARALMIAIDRDPTQPTPAERLAELYREKGDTKALVALLERRAKALAPIAQQSPEMRAHVATLHEELGRLWSEPPLSQPKKAIENYRRAIEYDAGSQYSIYALREMYKAQGQWAEAIPLFEYELRLVADPERRVALSIDEAEVRRSAGDLVGATQALRNARESGAAQDPSLKQQLAALVLERGQANGAVSPAERDEATQLFVELAEEYPGEHGFSYSLCALELTASNDRAMQLAIYYGEQLGRVNESAPHAANYLRSNPSGALAAEARGVVTQAMELGGDESLIDALGPAPDAGAEERVAGLVEVAQALARKAKKNEAAAKYREVLALDPDNLDAMSFLEPYYRQSRKFVELRDTLLGAARTEDADVEQRKAWLKEAATLSETQLRDPNGAITTLREIVQLDGEDETARSQLKRLLEKSGQWDALAEVLAQEAEQTIDVEARISLEKALAKLHEQKRKDPIATGETWSRIASLSPDDDEAILTAVAHFEQAQRLDLAAKVIADNLEGISAEETRAALLEKMGTLRWAAGEAMAAGDAFAEAAALVDNGKLWKSAEQAFVHAEAWEQAANAVNERAELTSGDKERAALFALEADYLQRAGDEGGSLSRLETATDLDPLNEDYAALLEARYEQGERREELASYFLKRAERLTDRTARVRLRQRAATLQRDALGDVEGARATLIAVLADGDEPEALLWLADDAQQGGEPQSAAEYLERLIKVTDDPDKKVEYALREAQIFADGLGDAETAIARYQTVLDEYDPKHTGALERIADLNDRLDRPRESADALEKRLALLSEPEAKLATAERLAALYEGPLDEPKAAIRVLDVVRELEPENFDAVQRLAELCERVEDWPRVAELSALLIEVEGDEQEVSRMTRRLAEILNDKVGKGDEALAALIGVADQGDEPCREAYVELGDKLGWKGIVATKLMEWYVDAPIGAKRNEALRGAFDRFLDVGRKADAANVAKELARTRGADPELAGRLEAIAVELKDLEALTIAHDLLVQPLSGPPRAFELVRQAEVLAEAGVDSAEAIQHGEQALTSVPPSEVGPLLERLAALAKDPSSVIDVFERQVTRCKSPPDRLRALARAAQVAANNEVFERARQFLDVALGGSVQEETLQTLEDTARASDAERGGDRLRRTLAEAFASGGQGSRDGGRTRGALLGRAAQLAHHDLNDTAQAFTWLGDAIVAHVDDERLDALDALANEIGEPKRAEAVLSRALEEVFDGPLVRRLLARRAGLRRERLNDLPGAAADLKKLHDLSPSDLAVMEQLSALYTELKDYRGMVQLYEDQILRGKDPASRAELARKVARLWEDELSDPREAADAWRRVLRMKANDPEASEGLDRAKANMLKRRAEPEPPSAPEAALVPAPAPAAAAKRGLPPPPVSSSATAEPALTAPLETETLPEPAPEQGAAEPLGATSEQQPADEPAEGAEVAEAPVVADATSNELTPLPSLQPPAPPPALLGAEEDEDDVEAASGEIEVPEDLRAGSVLAAQVSATLADAPVEEPPPAEERTEAAPPEAAPPEAPAAASVLASAPPKPPGRVAPPAKPGASSPEASVAPPPPGSSVRPPPPPLVRSAAPPPPPPRVASNAAAPTPVAVGAAASAAASGADLLAVAVAGDDDDDEEEELSVDDEELIDE